MKVYSVFWFFFCNVFYVICYLLELLVLSLELGLLGFLNDLVMWYGWNKFCWDVSYKVEFLN